MAIDNRTNNRPFNSTKYDRNDTGVGIKSFYFSLLSNISSQSRLDRAQSSQLSCL